MVVCAPIFGILGNIYGMKWVLIFGTLSYAPYSVALYCNSVYSTEWFLIFGAATCGLSVSETP
jgi:MFS family permease